jgi:thymidylate synthase
MPYSRRILTNMYNFADLSEMGLEPCAYSMTFNVTGNVLNGILNQRSQDILAANAWNVCQYAVLMHMLAQVSGLVAGELVHVISDAHIYDRHLPVIEELIARPAYPAPVFRINPDVKDFYDFTLDDFALENYQHGEQIRGIPVAV